MPDDWKSLKIPLGLVAAALIALGGMWQYLHTEYVLADDFRQYQQSREMRDLERDRKAVELDVLKLSVKKEAMPSKFDPVDRRVLERQQQELKELNAQIQDARKRSAR